MAWIESKIWTLMKGRSDYVLLPTIRPSPSPSAGMGLLPVSAAGEGPDSDYLCGIYYLTGTNNKYWQITS